MSLIDLHIVKNDEEYGLVGTAGTVYNLDGFISDSNAASFNGPATFNSSITANKNVKIANNLTVDGTSTLNGTITCNDLNSKTNIYCTNLTASSTGKFATISTETLSATDVIHTTAGDIYISSNGNLYTNNGNVYTNDGDIYTDSGNIYTTDGNISCSKGTLTATTINASGTITGNTVVGQVYNDYAEFFPKGEETEPGDIIALDLESNKEQYIKATDSAIVGVHTDEFSHIIGGEIPDKESYSGDDYIEFNKTKYIPVGLAGRVHVKVTGPVKKGQYIKLSAAPGIGIASDISDKSIGMALENNNNPNIKLIKIYINIR